MSDYNFSNLKSIFKKCAGGSALSERIFIVLLNVHKTPPHLAVMANGMVCSLSVKGGFKRDEGVNNLLRMIKLKGIPTLFIELRKPPHIEIGSKYLKSIFANIERASLKTQDFCSDSRRKKFLNRSLPIVNEDLKISDNAENEQKDKFLEVPSIAGQLFLYAVRQLSF